MGVRGLDGKAGQALGALLLVLSFTSVKSASTTSSFFGLRCARTRCGTGPGPVAPGQPGWPRIHGLAELHRGLRQGVGLGLDGSRRPRGFSAAFRSASAVSIAALRSAAPTLSPNSLSAFSVEWTMAVGLVAAPRPARVALLVLGGVRLGVLHHLLDVGVGETTGGLDADLLLLAGALVLGLDVARCRWHRCRR